MSWPLSVLDCRAPSPTKIENRELNLERVLFARLFEFSDCRSVRSFESQTFRILYFLHFFFMIFGGRICRSAFFLQQRVLTALGWEQGLCSYPNEGKTNHCESGPSKLEVGTRIPGPNQSWIIAPPPPTEIENREPDLECFLGSWLREFSKLSEFSTFRISYLSILWYLTFFLSLMFRDFFMMLFDFQRELLSALEWKRKLYLSPTGERAVHHESGLSKREVGTWNPGPYQSRTIAPLPPTKIRNLKLDLEAICYPWKVLLMATFEKQDFWEEIDED